VQETLVGWNAQAIEIALAAGVGAKECLGFGGVERADLGDGVGREVYRELAVGEGEIAGEALGGFAGGVPVAFFLRGG